MANKIDKVYQNYYKQICDKRAKFVKINRIILLITTILSFIFIFLSILSQNQTNTLYFSLTIIVGLVTALLSGIQITLLFFVLFYWLGKKGVPILKTYSLYNPTESEELFVDVYIANKKILEYLENKNKKDIKDAKSLLVAASKRLIKSISISTSGEVALFENRLNYLIKLKDLISDKILFSLENNEFESVSQVLTNLLPYLKDNKIDVDFFKIKGASKLKSQKVDFASKSKIIKDHLKDSNIKQLALLGIISLFPTILLAIIYPAENYFLTFIALFSFLILINDKTNIMLNTVSNFHWLYPVFKDYNQKKLRK